MPAPSLFPPRREPLISYDYFDAAEGTGYDIYYGLKGDNGEYLTTTTNQVYSEEITTELLQTVATTATKYFDLDFDITFNKPKNIKGKIFANIPMGMNDAPTNQEDHEYYCIVKAVHYDGSTETILATGTSMTVSHAGSYGFQNTGIVFSANIMVCVMNLTTQKHFKKGETLRFIVEGWYKCLEGTAKEATLQIAHDPQNRASQQGVTIPAAGIGTQFANEPSGGGTLTYQKTQMSFHVPFVIEI